MARAGKWTVENGVFPVRRRRGSPARFIQVPLSAASTFQHLARLLRQHIARSFQSRPLAGIPGVTAKRLLRAETPPAVGKLPSAFSQTSPLPPRRRGAVTDTGTKVAGHFTGCQRDAECFQCSCFRLEGAYAQVTVIFKAVRTSCRRQCFTVDARAEAR